MCSTRKKEPDLRIQNPENKHGIEAGYLQKAKKKPTWNRGKIITEFKRQSTESQHGNEAR